MRATPSPRGGVGCGRGGGARAGHPGRGAAPALPRGAHRRGGGVPCWQAEGEVSDSKNMKTVESISSRIDKYEEEAQKSGALDSKNEAERVRLIKEMGKVIGELQSDDIVVSA